MTDAAVWTSPEDRGTCGFCGKSEGGYAKKDANGVMQPACWPCVSKGLEPVPVQKRAAVGVTRTEDLDTDTKLAAAAKEAKKVKGLAPSTFRASTW